MTFKASSKKTPYTNSDKELLTDGPQRIDVQVIPSTNDFYQKKKLSVP